MFVTLRDVTAAKRVIATLLATALVAYSFAYSHQAEAANITSVSDILSDSAPAVVSNHDFVFTMSSTGAVATSTGSIVLDFNTTGFTGLASLTSSDVSMTVNGTAQDLTGTGWTFTPAASTLTFASVGKGVGAGATVEIKIGTNVTGGTNQITNPTPTNGDESFEINISAGTDSGHTRVVILNTVLVTANVSTSFNFQVNGLATSTAVNGTTTTGAAGSTTLAFGKLSAYQPKTLAQNLTVSTNAIHGYAVTVQSDGYFKSSTGAVIDNFVDGSDTNTPTAWAVPSNIITNNTTWGHWGVTSDDHTTGVRAAEFASSTWIGVTTTPRTVFAYNGPADGVTPEIGSTTVGYTVEITPLQEAGDDYQTVLTYIATPTF